MLPARDGVGSSQVALPPGPWTCLLDFLAERFPAIGAGEWRSRMARGDVVDAQGRAVVPHQPYQPLGRLYYYRCLPGEALEAAPVSVLFEDELLVVADKPHFVAVTPSGQYLQRSLLVRLRRQLGIDALTPLHRIDRETAGLVLFAKQPASCAAYHQLFNVGAVRKTYEAMARFDPALQLPLTRTSRLVEGRHFMQMREAAPGDPGTLPARTEVELVETCGSLARYRLRPFTGKRHQLRVHMAALGLPILGDRIYPTLLAPGGDDATHPLRLLAQHLEFTDPLTRQQRRFTSERTLAFPLEAADPAAST